MSAHEFEAEIQGARGGGAYVIVPADIRDLHDGGRSIRVRGTVDGVAFESSVASMGGCRALGVHKATRKTLGKEVGDIVRLVVERDERERTVTVPADLHEAFDANPTAREHFDRLAFTPRKEYVVWIESAKREETRSKRIAEAIAKLARGERLR